MVEHLQGLSMSQLNDMHASMLLAVVSSPEFSMLHHLPD